jgi:hypothetical protein
MFVLPLSLLVSLIGISQPFPLADSFGFRSGPAGIAKRQSSISGPVVADDFPDPAVVLVKGGYYAFSTSSRGFYVPSANSIGTKQWTLNSKDPLPSLGVWATGNDIWAPDVVQLVSRRQLALQKLSLTREGRSHVRHVLQCTARSQSWCSLCWYGKVESSRRTLCGYRSTFGMSC